MDFSTLPVPTTDDLASQPSNSPTSPYSITHLLIVRSIIDTAWPPLLAALSFIISTNLSDELFVDVLASFQAMTNVSGMLGLTTPRDAFLTGLGKFSVPGRVVAGLDSYSSYGGEPPTPRSATMGSLSENLGLSLSGHPNSSFSSSSATAPGLSERNLACLKVLVSSAMFLAGSLGESWFGILEVLQNADYVLTSKGVGGGGGGGGFGGGVTSPPGSTKRGTGSGVFSPGMNPNRSISASGSGGQGLSSATSSESGGPGPARHPLLTDLDTETMQNVIQRLFDASKNLEDAAFRDFIDALCKLSKEMIGMQVQTEGAGEILGNPTDESGGFRASGSLEELNVLSPPLPETPSRRRVSGIHLPRTLVCGPCFHRMFLLSNLFTSSTADG